MPRGQLTIRNCLSHIFQPNCIMICFISLFEFGLLTIQLIYAVRWHSRLYVDASYSYPHPQRTNIMELYENLVKCDIHIQVKQHIMLDIIVKIMILIETTLVLVDALSMGYHMVVKKLTYYSFSDVYQIMENILTSKHNHRKVLGFPSVGKTISINEGGAKISG